MAFSCTMCGFLSPTFKLHVSHLRLVHSKSNQFQVLCPVLSCQLSFNTFPSFNSHVYRHHRLDIGLLKTVESTSGLLQSNFTGIEEIEEIPILPESEDFHSLLSPVSPHSHHSLQSAEVERRKKDVQENAKFIMSLTEGKQMSQVAVQEVIIGCRKVCERTITLVKERVELAVSRLSPGTTGDLHLVQAAFDDIPDAFSGIDTPYLREKYYKEFFGYLVSYIIFSGI